METSIAAIDVGTNSVHMIVARASATGFEILTSEKVMVRLGSGEGDELTDAAMQRGVEALRKMKDIAVAYDADIHAVATSAVREAPNAANFLERIRSETGIDVRVISGSEEARLIFLGVSRCLALGPEKTLMIDIGGGSTEFSLSEGGHLQFAQSLKLGAVRLTEKFLPNGVLKAEATAKLRRHINSKFSMISHELRDAGFSRVIVSSGTCETIARMVALRRTGTIPQSMNGFQFTHDDFDLVLKEILDCETPKARSELTGMDTKRSDIIAAGALVLREVVESLNVDRLEYSDYSLREGVLFDAIGGAFDVGSESIDTSHDSVLRLAQRCSVNMSHAGHVAMLSRQLLAQISEIFDVDPSLDKVLTSAAYLANTGAAISYSKHHLHSYYIIRNADLLGFTDDEIEMIALIARYHRKSIPKPSHPEFARLSDQQQEDIELLAGVLRVATALDRSHDQSVTSVRVSPVTEDGDADSHSSDDVGRLLISIATANTSHHHMTELNLHTARERINLLEIALDADVEVDFAS